VSSTSSAVCLYTHARDQMKRARRHCLSLIPLVWRYWWCCCTAHSYLHLPPPFGCRTVPCIHPCHNKRYLLTPNHDLRYWHFVTALNARNHRRCPYRHYSRSSECAFVKYVKCTGNRMSSNCSLHSGEQVRMLPRANTGHPTEAIHALH
jgi:hypothetical protein